VGGISSPGYELRLSLGKRGDVGRGGDVTGIGGGARLVAGASGLGVSTVFEGFSDISSSDSEPILRGATTGGGGGGGGRAKVTS
jgi:hypothetical protein